MKTRLVGPLLWIAIGLALSACASSSAPVATGPAAEAPVSVQAAPKRISAAIRGAPVSLITQRTERGGGVRGLDGIEELTHAGMSYIKNDGTRAAQLAEAVPSIENGLWKVLPDGRMETTWRLREGARWQDGTPVTAGDFLFAAAVEQDRDLEIPAYAEYDAIEAITAPDPRTLLVTWKRTYIEADGLFSYRAAGLPMPKHLLGQWYEEDKTAFLGLPFWSEQFVGAGAYQVRDWARDSHTVLKAFDGYVLGRPKIDEIEVRFIPDNNALTAYILAGGDLTLGKTISLDIALGVRDKWTDGRMLIVPANWTPINVQFTNPDPPVVGDVRFRRALLHAIDRQQLADYVFSGHGAAAHSFVSPEVPLYSIVEPAVVKYDHSVRRAAELIEELGYAKRADGFYYDGAGQKLSVVFRTPVQNDIHPKTIPVVADFWQRAGVGVEQELVPIQRTRDREWRSQFPAFEMIERRNTIAVSEIYRFHSSQMPSPENRYNSGGVSRYGNPELDAWLERYVTTIPMVERMQALGGFIHHQTEYLPHLPLMHGADPTLVSNRLLNVTARGDNFTQAWNVQEWDLKS